MRRQRAAALAPMQVDALGQILLLRCPELHAVTIQALASAHGQCSMLSSPQLRRTAWSGGPGALDAAADMLSRGTPSGAGPGGACPLLLRACAHGGPPIEHQGALYGFCSAAVRQRFSAAPFELVQAATAAVLRAPHLRQLLGLPAAREVLFLT